jgi:hypothetical protein
MESRESMKRLKRWLAIILMGAVAHLLMPWSVHAQRTEEEQKAEDVQQQAEEAQKALELFLREQRVVFRQGEGALELGLFYSLDTKDSFLRSAEGRVFVAKLTKRTILPILTLRYALVNDLELDIIAPFYGYSELETDLGGAHQRISDSGPTDITGLVRYQLWHERGPIPDVILDVRGQSRAGGNDLLGTGYWTVGGGITLVKTLDPVVFFGRLGYTYTLERGGLDPGNEIAFLSGTGFSLNDRVSFTMQVNGIFTGDAKLNGRTVNHSNLESISLQLGATVQVTKYWFVEPFVSLGLSDDAPDVALGINVVRIRLPIFRRSQKVS